MVVKKKKVVCRKGGKKFVFIRLKLIKVIVVLKDCKGLSVKVILVYFKV